MRRFLRERIECRSEYRLGRGHRHKAYIGRVRVPLAIYDWVWNG